MPSRSERGRYYRLTSLERLSQRPVRTELDLLKAQHQKTRLVGRDRDFESLWQWLHSDRRILIRTVVGPGGTGKARLASEDAQWQRGFVIPGDLSWYGAAQDLAELSWDQPALVIVDCAAFSTGALRKVLPKLACAPDDGHRLRLLPLEAVQAAVLRAARRAPLAVATTIVPALQDFHHTGRRAPADWLRALVESAGRWDAFLPDLAMSLNNVAAMLRGLTILRLCARI
jgi:hypothetical protein